MLKITQNIISDAKKLLKKHDQEEVVSKLSKKYDVDTARMREILVRENVLAECV